MKVSNSAPIPFLLKRVSFAGAKSIKRFCGRTRFRLSHGSTMLMLAATVLLASVSGAEDACPHRGSQLDLGNYSYVLAMAVNERHFLTADTRGVTAWDASDPLEPQPIGSWVQDSGDSAAAIQRLLVNGRYAYAARHRQSRYSTAIVVLDLESPSGVAEPVQIVGSESDDVWAYDVAGDYLLTVSSTAKLYDLRDPRSPRFLSQFGLGFLSCRLAGRYAILAKDDSIEVFDLAVPTDPQQIGSLDYSFSTSSPRIWFFGSLALVNGGNYAVRVIDLTDPSNPRFVEDSLPAMVAMIETNGRVFGAGSGKLYEIDLSDPLAPVVAQQIEIPMVGHHIGARGNYVWVAHDPVWSYGSSVTVDISDGLTIVAETYGGSLGSDLDVQDERAVVALLTGGVQVLDVTDVDHVSTVSHLEVRPMSSAFMAVIHGDTVYAAGRSPYETPVNSLYVWDLSSATSTQAANEIQTGMISSMAADDDLLVLTVDSYSASPAAWLLDISAPAEPETLAIWPMVYQSHGALVADGAVLLGALDAVTVLDVSEPSSPQQVGQLGLPECSVHRIVRSGEFAFVLGLFGLSYVLDISDPLAPAIVAEIPEIGHSAAFSGSTILVGDSTIVATIDISDFEIPVARYYRASRATDGVAFIAGQAVALADPFLEVLDLDCGPPVANFSFYGSGTDVWFVNETEGWVGEYQWDFGDGTTSQSVSPVHEYDEEGTYTVSLEVDGEGSDSEFREIFAGRVRARRGGGRITP